MQLFPSTDDFAPSEAPAKKTPSAPASGSSPSTEDEDLRRALELSKQEAQVRGLEGTLLSGPSLPSPLCSLSPFSSPLSCCCCCGCRALVSILHSRTRMEASRARNPRRPRQPRTQIAATFQMLSQHRMRGKESKGRAAHPKPRRQGNDEPQRRKSRTSTMMTMTLIPLVMVAMTVSRHPLLSSSWCFLACFFLVLSFALLSAEC